MSRVLTIKTLPNKRDEPYIDCDHIFLHAAFQVLVDYVEQEKPFEHFACADLAWKGEDPSPEDLEDMPLEEWLFRKANWNRLFDLYHWWKGRDDDTAEEEEDDMRLMELCELRGHLWT